jgi:hypothetical protein
VNLPKQNCDSDKLRAIELHKKTTQINALNNRVILLRYYASLTNFLMSGQKQQCIPSSIIENILLSYVGFPHKKIISHLVNPASPLIFATHAQYKSLSDADKEEAFLVNKDTMGLLVPTKWFDKKNANQPF